MTNPTQPLKILCLIALFFLLAVCIVIAIDVDESLVAARKSTPALVAGIRGDLAAQVNAKLDPLVTQYAATGKALAGTATEARGLIADVRKEIPWVRESTTKEISELNERVDALNASVAKVADFPTALQPAIDGLNLMFRRDAVPAQTLGLLGASKVAAGEVAQTMKTVRDTVKAEAAPTAKAVRESAEGTAGTTAATAKLIGHVDDLFFGPRTFWQKVKGWLALLIGPGALVGAKAL